MDQYILGLSSPMVIVRIIFPSSPLFTYQKEILRKKIKKAK